MEYTSHMNLKKPEYTDTRDIKDINDNMEAIDSAIWGLQNAGSQNANMIMAVASNGNVTPVSYQNVGSGNAGKFMVVNNSGNVVPTTVPFANGGTY